MNKLKRWVFTSDSVHNMRDLGGYVCDGGATRYGVVLRSDQLYGLSEDEMQRLKQNGLTDVIDLRSDGERLEMANDFLHDKDVCVHSIKVGHEGDAYQFSPKDFTSMGEMYTKLCDANGHQYTDMVRTVANAKGMCIIHCMAGKDRTGILCALILLALGVSESDVVADYQISETHILNNKHIQKLRDQMPAELCYLQKSSPENMWMLIEHLRKNHGGSRDYLLNHGLQSADLDRLRIRLVEPIEP